MNILERITSIEEPSQGTRQTPPTTNAKQTAMDISITFFHLISRVRLQRARIPTENTSNNIASNGGRIRNKTPAVDRVLKSLLRLRGITAFNKIMSIKTGNIRGRLNASSILKCHRKPATITS
ncbi:MULTISPECIES: hypothetical protein [Roseivirga]|uniref:hypothetical protein n=1 Tax=Roseivirga TaxID=290180 RepID=UPI0012FE3767|nr:MULTISPECIES: hypothetical protein [Roseivirga]MBO6659737.1 hypothetical protein [Roseivirga sp.]MBO6760287.1 hypothetical protein [Roseivirga sp.]MBO6907526.1 hypothetical protein [Roseivirga sp.]WPZ09900.1 hypothetical protein T7867_16665 [Roseivirga spongicola]